MIPVALKTCERGEEGFPSRWGCEEAEMAAAASYAATCGVMHDRNENHHKSVSMVRY